MADYQNFFEALLFCTPRPRNNY